MVIRETPEMEISAKNVKKSVIAQSVKDRDVVLCRAFNRNAVRSLCDVLVRSSIPFSQNWRHIPFFLRSYYRGKKEYCEISINRTEYSKARRAIDVMDDLSRRRLQLNYI